MAFESRWWQGGESRCKENEEAECTAYEKGEFSEGTLKFRLVGAAFIVHCMLYWLFQVINR